MMKKGICLILAAFMIALCAVSLAEQASFSYSKERIDENMLLNLIDIRTEEAFSERHIPRSINIPAQVLEESFLEIMEDGFSYLDTEIILCGEAADTCQAAAQTLEKLGFTNVSWMDQVSQWPYRLISTEEETAQMQRILGGMDTVDIYGQPVSEAIISGHKLNMVNVWGTYCNPCIAEMPELARLNRELADVQIIGIVSDTLDTNLKKDATVIALAREIAGKTGADYHHIVPDAVIVSNVLSQISAVPTTFFLDADGNIVGKVYVGSRDYAAWLDIIQSTLQEVPEQ